MIVKQRSCFASASVSMRRVSKQRQHLITKETVPKQHRISQPDVHAYIKQDSGQLKKVSQAKVGSTVIAIDARASIHCKLNTIL